MDLGSGGGDDQRPTKRQRRLADPTDEEASSLLVPATPQNAPLTDDAVEAVPESTAGEPILTDSIDGDDFDYDTFQAVVGCPVSRVTIDKIRRSIRSDELQNVVNAYFDGSWGADTSIAESAEVPPEPPQAALVSSQPQIDQLQIESEDTNVLDTSPRSRYVGAFGVAAWATTSGSHLIEHGESVAIERVKMRSIPKRGRQKEDYLTRFVVRGKAIGRLPQETAAWVSTLLDQKVCELEGVCVFAPDRLRVNDTIYLQLKCFLLDTAFRSPELNVAGENTGPRFFESQETTEEKMLRQRQIALIKLFTEMNVEPTAGGQTGLERRKEDLLRAAESADQSPRPSTQAPNGGADEEEGATLEQDQLDSLYKKTQAFDFNTPETEPSDTFALELRRYQKQALHWMLSKEKDIKPQRQMSMHPLWEEYTWPVKDMDDNPLPRVRGQDKFYLNPYSGELSLKFPAQEQHCLGGILADEMGLGKTIEMMSLIHTHRLSEMEVSEWTENKRFSSYGLQEVTPAPYTTLVVAPMSLLAQWAAEAERASKEGTMKVRIYYGNNRIVDLRRQCYDRHDAYDVIVTSYGVVLSEFGGELAPDKELPGLFGVKFLRVILDEAHLIKNRNAKTARACYALNAVHRWALTGTPIVNRLEDLYSLVRYLKVEPWSDFSFWRTFITIPFESKNFLRALSVVQTVLEPLVLRRTKNMKTPDGEALVPLPTRTVKVENVELSKAEREIYDLIFTRAQRTFNENVAAGTLLKSYTTIFAQILRLRQVCCHPILTRNRDIVADEEDAAAVSEQSNQLQDDMDLQDLINRFTAACDEADASERDHSVTFTTAALKQIQNDASGECPICSEEPMINPAVTPCWHTACKGCIEHYVKHQTDRRMPPRCPVCRDDISIRDIFEIVRHSSPSGSITPIEHGTPSTQPPPSQVPRISLRRVNPLSPSTQTSAKITALIQHLVRLPPNSKAVVFSQFTSFLDLIGPRLQREKINFVRLDGTMTQKDRATVLSDFNRTEVDFEEEIIDGTSIPKPKIPTVLLISLRAGGVGLNLTAANYVFMMDPWWSFAVESQAIDRVHRMGQLREVHVTRFIVQHSIEERMLRIQEKKMMIAGSLGLRLGGEGEEERRKERIEDLKLLFE
ncbi:DNA repair protein rad5 [Ascosphaera apis ARSEF 7405]|uniref:DNA repair protein rad5 n=1 Tax=Ascosphaera apis ARSEF 7405 TaxID=392613 RepID=A0A166P654_9EURO|nr:DNA repair protein rad5 [Ascosphaera apis ARSEF 7405]